MSPSLEQLYTWQGDSVLGALFVGNETFARYVKMCPNLAKS